MENTNEAMNEQMNAPEPEANQHTDNGAEATPSIDDLLAQITEMKTENNRLKTAYNKASSEAADYKKKFRARQTAEEQEAESKREAEEAIQNELKSLRATVAVQKATERYMGLGMDKETAKETANFEVSGDNEAVTSNIQKFMANQIKAKESEWLASRPEVSAGNGESGSEEKDPFILGFNNPR